MFENRVIDETLLDHERDIFYGRDNGGKDECLKCAHMVRNEHTGPIYRSTGINACYLYVHSDVFEGTECGETAFCPFSSAIEPLFCLGAPPQDDHEFLVVKDERRKYFCWQGNAGRSRSICIVFVREFFQH